MTSLYPHTINVRENKRYALEESALTMAEHFAEAGYATAGFVSSFTLNERFGIGQGFSFYDDEFTVRRGFRRFLHRARDVALILRLVHGALLTTDAAGPMRTGDEVTTRALDWLREHRREQKQQPFFMWIHYMEPHAPYNPPMDFKPAPRKVLDPFYQQGDPDSLYSLWGGDIRSLAAMHQLYDGEVAYMVKCVGELIEGIQESFGSANNLVCFTADHGESPGEHNYLSHEKNIYNANVRVPLIFSFPQDLPQNQRTQTRASGVDIFPTVCDLVGLPRPQPTQGENLVEFLPLASAERRGFTYVETQAGAKIGLYLGPWKLVQDANKGGRELYAWLADLHELDDVAGENPALADSLENLLNDFYQATEGLYATDASSIALEEESEKRFRALGYLN